MGLPLPPDLRKCVGEPDFIIVDTRLSAAATLREEAGQALEGCRILVSLITFVVSRILSVWTFFY